MSKPKDKEPDPVKSKGSEASVENLVKFLGALYENDKLSGKAAGSRKSHEDILNQHRESNIGSASISGGGMIYYLDKDRDRKQSKGDVGFSVDTPGEYKFYQRGETSWSSLRDAEALEEIKKLIEALPEGKRPPEFNTTARAQSPKRRSSVATEAKSKPPQFAIPLSLQTNNVVRPPIITTKSDHAQIQNRSEITTQTSGTNPQHTTLPVDPDSHDQSKLYPNDSTKIPEIIVTDANGNTVEAGNSKRVGSVDYNPLAAQIALLAANHIDQNTSLYDDIATINPANKTIEPDVIESLNGVIGELSRSTFPVEPIAQKKETHYEIIGADPKASSEKIKELRKQLLPKFRTVEDQRSDEYKNLVAAFGVLLDTESRRKYDVEIGVKTSQIQEASATTTNPDNASSALAIADRGATVIPVDTREEVPQQQTKENMSKVPTTTSSSPVVITNTAKPISTETEKKPLLPTERRSEQSAVDYGVLTTEPQKKAEEEANRKAQVEANREAQVATGTKKVVAPTPQQQQTAAKEETGVGARAENKATSTQQTTLPASNPTSHQSPKAAKFAKSFHDTFDKTLLDTDRAWELQKSISNLKEEIRKQGKAYENDKGKGIFTDNDNAAGIRKKLDAAKLGLEQAERRLGNYKKQKRGVDILANGIKALESGKVVDNYSVEMVERGDIKGVVVTNTKNPEQSYFVGVNKADMGVDGDKLLIQKIDRKAITDIGRTTNVWTGYEDAKSGVLTKAIEGVTADQKRLFDVDNALDLENFARNFSTASEAMHVPAQEQEGVEKKQVTGKLKDFLSNKREALIRGTITNGTITDTDFNAGKIGTPIGSHLDLVEEIFERTSGKNGGLSSDVRGVMKANGTTKVFSIENLTFAGNRGENGKLSGEISDIAVKTALLNAVAIDAANGGKSNYQISHAPDQDGKAYKDNRTVFSYPDKDCTRYITVNKAGEIETGTIDPITNDQVRDREREFDKTSAMQKVQEVLKTSEFSRYSAEEKKGLETEKDAIVNAAKFTGKGDKEEFLKLGKTKAKHGKLNEESEEKFRKLQKESGLSDTDLVKLDNIQTSLQRSPYNNRADEALKFLGGEDGKGGQIAASIKQDKKVVDAVAKDTKTKIEPTEKAKDSRSKDEREVRKKEESPTERTNTKTRFAAGTAITTGLAVASAFFPPLILLAIIAGLFTIFTTATSYGNNSRIGSGIGDAIYSPSKGLEKEQEKSAESAGKKNMTSGLSEDENNDTLFGHESERNVRISDSDKEEPTSPTPSASSSAAKTQSDRSTGSRQGTTTQRSQQPELLRQMGSSRSSSPTPSSSSNVSETSSVGPTRHQLSEVNSSQNLKVDARIAEVIGVLGKESGGGDQNRAESATDVQRPVTGREVGQ